MWCLYERYWSEFNTLSFWNWAHKWCSGIKTSLRNFKISFVTPAQLPHELSILFQLAKEPTEMNLKLLVSSVILVVS